MIVHINEKMVEKCGGEDGINQILEKFSGYGLTERGIVLNPEDIKKVQEILDKVVTNAPELVSHIEKLSQINISGSKFNFSPEQLIRLKDQATFYGKNPRDYVAEVVGNKMKELLGEI